jgi:hypothetical protein
MLAIVLTALSLVLAIACLVTRQRRIARFARGAGISVLACGALALVAGLAMTWLNTSAPGLSEADRMRMLSNGLAEATYNAMLTAVLSVPGLLAGHWVLHKSAPKDPTRVDPGASASG